jgi:hypothetical protein
VAFGVGGNRNVRGRGVSRCRESGAVCPGTSPATLRRVALPSARYESRRPAEDVLYQIVQAHFETFLAQAASLRDGEGLPPFVEGEFRAFLRCGSLAGGFARFRCTGCGLDRLVAFSCKGRGFCPRCGGRRMAERSAHLVDHVFQRVGTSNA